MTEKIKQLLIKELICGLLLCMFFVVFLMNTNVSAEEGSIIPEIILDKGIYTHGDVVQIALILKNIASNDCTNSVNFDIKFDSNAFELESGDLDRDIVEEYIDFTDKELIIDGSDCFIRLSLLDMQDNTYLQEGKSVFIIKFKVKEDASFGEKEFELMPVNMLDMDSNIYNVNNGQSVVAKTSLGNYAVVEGSIGLYLGDEGTGLNSYILNRLEQDVLNEALENTEFVLGRYISDDNHAYNGYQVFNRDYDGNIVVKGNDNCVKGSFKINVEDLSNKILTIGGNGFYNRETYISLEQGKPFYVGNDSIPFILYPGDVGSIKDGMLVFEADGKIDNIDFSAWLKIFKKHLEGNATPEEIIKADFTRDGTVNNVDFSLWFASYKKLLSNLLDEFEQGEGIIVANEYTTLTSPRDLDGEGKVTIRTIDERGFEKYDEYYVGSTKANELLGYNIEFKAAVDVINNKKVLMDTQPTNNKILFVNAIDIEYVQEGYDKYILEYWIDRENDYEPEGVFVDNYASLIYNGKARSLHPFDLQPISGELVFVDNNGDDIYDVVHVREYKYLIVDFVNSAYHTICDKNGEIIELNPYEENYKFSITKDGETIELNDIQEWDVLAVAADSDILYGSNRAKLMQVEVLNDTVEGRVTEVFVSDNISEYSIDGQKYEANRAVNLADYGVGLDSEGIFFLDLDGRIVYADNSMKSSRNYAYLIETGVETVFGSSTAQFRVLTMDGDIVVYDGSITIRFADKYGDETTFRKTGMDYNHAELIDILEVGQLVIIRLNENDEITRIEEASVYTLDNYFSIWAPLDNRLFRNGLFNRNYFVDSSTLVFDIPEHQDDYNKYFVRDGSIFLDNLEYRVELYDVNRAGHVAVVLLTNRAMNYDTGLVLVDRITDSTNSDGYPANGMYGIQDNDWINAIDDGEVLDGYKHGDAMLFETNVKNEIDDVTLLFTPNPNGGSESFEKWNNQYEEDPYAELYTAYGEVTSRRVGSIGVDILDNKGTINNVRFSTSGAKVYRYDFSRSSNRAAIVRAGEISQRITDTDGNIVQNGDMVFIRIDNSRVKEIVIYRY